MKIAIIGPAHPYRGGISDFNEALAIALEKEGHQLEILSFKKQYPSVLFPGKTQFRSHKAKHNLRIENLVHAYNPLNWFRVNAILKRSDFDLILVRYWTPFMAPALGSILRGIKEKTPVVAIVDNLVPHEKKLTDTILTSYFIKKISAFMTLSDSVAKDLKDFGVNAPIATSPHPLYDSFGEPISKLEARKKLNISENENVILFFGLVRKYKGLDLLLKALLQDQLKNLAIKLVVAGEFYDKKSDYQPEIQMLLDEGKLILEERFIPDEEVKYFFCASDLVAQTYHSATQSGVTQIAYHFEIPMLVTNVGGLPEMVPHEKVGYVVEGKESVIAENIQRFFELPENERFKEGLNYEKKRFSWQTFVQALMNLADSI